MTTRLFIGNKAYSSWSLRPWLLMRHFDIPFEEFVIPLDQPTTQADILRHSPTGKVPALAAEGITIWESLAIFDYCADRFPAIHIWPEDRLARAVARAVAAEMHAGFNDLRRSCPMNMRRPVRAIGVSEAVLTDVERIETIWRTARSTYGQGGPFLFGAFCAADAMFAPVVNRFDVYDLAKGPESLDYMAAIKALPAWRDWVTGASAEPWRLDKYEAI